jgi:hypothetical protein
MGQQILLTREVRHQKEIIKKLLNKWEMPHFKLSNVTSRNVNVQSYNYMQSSKHPSFEKEIDSKV